VRGLLLLLLLAAPAAADETNQVTVRGNYWRDRNTRVLQPEATLSKELSSGTILTAHYLLDAITSASQASGANRDQPFTEMRNEAGFGVGQRAGRALVTFGYSYSSEADYWAHTITAGTTVDLWQKNTTLSLAMAWGINTVARRTGSNTFVTLGGLQTWTAIASWTQVLGQHMLGIVEYDISVLGFGDQIGHLTGAPNMDTGLQANPYRMVNLAGAATYEQVPFQRIRQSAQATLHGIIPTRNRITPYVALRPSYRFYWDDWGLLAHTVELRGYLPVGPVELRLGGRYYNQNAAVFSNLINGAPGYTTAMPMGKKCGSCFSSSSTGLYFTSDPKLYAWDAFYLDVRLAISLRGLERFRRLPLHDWLAGGLIELSYGHWFNGKVARMAYGNADLAGLSLSFPL
jgi:Protein of unknown function (DUF3570)